MAPRKTENPYNEPDAETDIERPAFELSLTQIIAGTAAAVTAALLGSRLGVAGTIIGAALASVVSMIASAIYSHSIRAAKHRVRLARTQQQEPAEVANAQIFDETGALPVVTLELNESERAFAQSPSAMMPLQPLLPTTAFQLPATPPAALAQRAPAGRAKARRRLPTMALAGIGAVAAFGMALILLTGFETVSGTPVSGGQPGGLTILGGQSSGKPDVRDEDAPTESTAPSTTPSSSEPPAPASSGGETGTTTTVTETVNPSAEQPSDSPSSPPSSSAGEEATPPASSSSASRPSSSSPGAVVDTTATTPTSASGTTEAGVTAGSPR